MAHHKPTGQPKVKQQIMITLRQRGPLSFRDLAVHVSGSRTEILAGITDLRHDLYVTTAIHDGANKFKLTPAGVASLSET